MTEEQIPTETDETLSGTVSDPSTEEGNDTLANDETTEEEPETFPRSYVEKLRDESARHRQKAADRDDLAHRLHAALVTATGRLADPTDLAFDDAQLIDADTLTGAIDDLLAKKPHLASRKPSGDIGQGATLNANSIDLAAMLRHGAS